jgi:dTDP-4-amino-4,6-dideoxygalactose transaminase
MGYKKGICPQAEVLYEGIITLPLFPKMLDEEVGQVITSINDIISRVKR